MRGWGNEPEEERPAKAVPPIASSGMKDYGRMWFRGGVLAGLLLWLVALPLLGDPRISYVLPPTEGQIPAVLVARSSFQMAVEAPVETLARPPKPGTAPGTRAQLRMIQPVLWAMSMPEVRDVLGTGQTGPVLVVPTPVGGEPSQAVTARPAPTQEQPPPAPTAASPAATMPPAVPSPAVTGSPVPPTATAAPDRAPSPAVTQPSPPTATPTREPQFSFPENLAPGLPAATMAQVMNPTRQPVVAQIRPTIDQTQDTRLCPVLRSAIVSLESGKAPKMMMGGKIQEMAQKALPAVALLPGQRYNLAILVSAPWDLSNEYQGVSCTVNFMMYSQGT